MEETHNHIRITNNKRLEALDGLRAVACLAVMASHCHILNQGGFGVRYFFVLSGFFCISAFEEDKFFRTGAIIDYYKKRIIRILPTYYLVLLGAQFFTAGFERKALLENMLFINPYGHLWYMQHTMLFYLIVPFIHIAISFEREQFLSRYSKSISTLVIAVEFFLLSFLLSKLTLFTLPGNNTIIKFQIEFFLVGIGGRYLKEFLELKCYKIPKYGVDAAIFLLLSSFIYTSNSVLKRIDPLFSEYYIGWAKPMVCSYIAVTVVVLLAINGEGVMSRLLSAPIVVTAGKVSMTMYLIHYFMIPYIGLGDKYLNLLWLTINCFSIALFVYRYFEKPIKAFLMEK